MHGQSGHDGNPQGNMQMGGRGAGHSGPTQQQQQGSIQGYYGFVESIRHRSSVATINDGKIKAALIGSGGTYNFFHSRTSILEYQPLDKEQGVPASGTSIIVRKGFVLFLWMDENILKRFMLPTFLPTSYLLVSTPNSSIICSLVTLLPRTEWAHVSSIVVVRRNWCSVPKFMTD